MTMFAKTLAVLLAATALAMNTVAQSQNETRSTLLPIENEPAPKLMVESPLPEGLARGVAQIRFRVENIRIMPVVGETALAASPRIGHFHITVDDMPWHWAEFADNTNTIIVASLPPGQHKILIELADANHTVFAGQSKTVTFTIPDTGSHSHSH